VRFLSCLDSPALAESRRRELDISREPATLLGQSAVAAATAGVYENFAGVEVDFRAAVQAACAAKVSIPPDAPLPAGAVAASSVTEIQVANQTTLGAARRLVAEGRRPLALNFANGVTPGGGFLRGTRGQEETLCRSSALYLTLDGDPMYLAHRSRSDHKSSAWSILSPVVPVFRDDAGHPLDEPYLLDFITCAAPVAQRVGQPRSADLLRERVHRVLAVARAYGYDTLILGAWGCGAFGNDPERTAADFREALEGEFRGAFSKIIFAITDWSDDRKFLGPFRTLFDDAPPTTDQ
jgi:uncharacterized protein (TIGR02452 family)